MMFSCIHGIPPQAECISCRAMEKMQANANDASIDGILQAIISSMKLFHVTDKKLSEVVDVLNQKVMDIDKRLRIIENRSTEDAPNSRRQRKPTVRKTKAKCKD